MNANYDKDLKTLTVVFTDNEHSMFTRVRQALGIRSVEAQLETWLFAQTRELSSKDMDLIKDRLSRANVAEIDSIKTALGIS